MEFLTVNMMSTFDINVRVPRCLERLEVNAPCGPVCKAVNVKEKW